MIQRKRPEYDKTIELHDPCIQDLDRAWQAIEELQKLSVDQLKYLSGLLWGHRHAEKAVAGSPAGTVEVSSASVEDGEKQAEIEGVRIKNLTTDWQGIPIKQTSPDKMLNPMKNIKNIERKTLNTMAYCGPFFEGHVRQMGEYIIYLIAEIRRIDQQRICPDRSCPDHSGSYASLENHGKGQA